MRFAISLGSGDFNAGNWHVRSGDRCEELLGRRGKLRGVATLNLEPGPWGRRRLSVTVHGGEGFWSLWFGVGLVTKAPGHGCRARMERAHCGGGCQVDTMRCLRVAYRSAEEKQFCRSRRGIYQYLPPKNREVGRHATQTRMIASFASTATTDATKTVGGSGYSRQPVIAQVVSVLGCLRGERRSARRRVLRTRKVG